MKALKINVVDKTVTEIDVDNWQQISGKIGNNCQLFCCPIQFENGDILYADDESLLRNDIEGMFVIDKFIIVGNAIISGSDEDGESTDAKSSIDEIKSKVVFGDKQGALAYQHAVSAKMPILFSGFNN